MRRRLFLPVALLVHLLTLSWGFGQNSPYHFDWKKEGVIISTGALALGIGQHLRSNMPTLSQDEIFSLQAKSLAGIDRVAIDLDSPRAYRASNYLLKASFVLPALFLLEKKSRHGLPKIALLYTETMLTNAGLTLLTKSAIQRPRPFVYNEKAGLESKQSQHARSSFISGHTSNVAASCFFSAKVFADYYPDSKWKPVVWGVAATLPAITGYLRVKAGKHYPSDVIAGYGVGAALGILIPQLHKKKGPLQLYGGPGGVAVELQF